MVTKLPVNEKPIHCTRCKVAVPAFCPHVPCQSCGKESGDRFALLNGRRIHWDCLHGFTLMCSAMNLAQGGA